MLPDTVLLTVVMSVLIMAARFGRLAKALVSQLFAKSMIGSLKNGRLNSRPPQAVANSTADSVAPA